MLRRLRTRAFGQWLRKWLERHPDIESILRLFSATVLYTAFDDRLTFADGLRAALAKRVPAHALPMTWWTGGLSLLLSVNQVVTGVLLSMYYKPSADAAYDSVQFIMTHVPMGWLVRQMHAWGAHLMIVVVLIQHTIPRGR